MVQPEAFQKAEDEYFVLRGKFEAGRITRPAFLAEVGKLQARDANGKWVAIDPETGHWVESRPPAPDLGATEQHRTGPSSRPSSLPEQRRKGRSMFAIAAIIASALVFLLLIGVVGFFTFNKPSVNAKVVATTAPQAIAAKDFYSLNQLLALRVAAMNQAQLKFIRDMRATSYNGRVPGLAFPLFQKGSALTDQDLKDIAGKAMDVAILADQVGELAGRQDKGSPKAAQSADAFYAMARNALSLALDAQNVRTALQSGLIPGGQAIDTIASYGVNLWNASVTDGSSKGNPFAAQTKSGGEPSGFLNPAAVSQVQTQAGGNNASLYVAQSATQNTRTINVPAAKSPVPNPFDPQVLNSLTTPEGQNDANKSQQVAAANLQQLGAKSSSTDPSQPTQLLVPTSPVAVAGGDQVKAGNIPTFKSGKATVVSKNNPTDDNAFLNNVGLNGDQPPSDQGKTTVQDAPPLVSLTISNINITNINKRPKDAFNTFEADVTYDFTVNWSTTLAAPQFSLDCVSSNHYDITSANGSAHVNAKGLLILYPGAEDAFCYASRNGNTWGSASIHFLVGDAAGATQRAIQVETDSVSLDRTLTAEAQSTSSAEQTRAAATQSAQQTQAAATAQALATQHSLETEVAADKTAEFKITAAAFATRQAQPPPATAIPSATPTFTPKVVDNLFHAGNEFGVSSKVVLQRGRLYRFTFSGRVNLINPTKSVTANQLPEHVNGVTVPVNGIVVLQGTGGVATITCGSGDPDPKDPGGYGIVVEDLGPY